VTRGCFQDVEGSKNACGSNASNTRSSAGLSLMSMTSSGTPAGTFAAFPVDRSSTIRVFQPSATSSSTTCEPMNPAPPVTIARPVSMAVSELKMRATIPPEMDTAMILAAGKGTRLGDLGRAHAKVMIDVGGESLLARHLRLLESLGVQRVVINVSHLAEQVQDAARAYAGPIEIVCIEELELLGTSGGVRNALDHLLPGPFIVMYGDVLVREQLAPMLEAHKQHGGVATLAVYGADDALGKGTVETDSDGQITGFAEKEDHGSATDSFLINAGIYVLEAELVAELEAGAFSDFGLDVFPRALANGRALFVYELSEPVIDVGTPEGLAAARSSAAK
jgi:NDP-sugar pyrophosphorylase family protein